MTQPDSVLDVKNLSVVHPARGRRGTPVAAVADVSLTVGAGQIVGVVGESGSGKTSLAMAVAGVGRVSSGEIAISGRTLGPRMSRDTRAEIQVVLQDPHASLDPRQSVRRGIRELRRIHRQRTAWTTDEELLARVGLSTDLLDRLPHQISGGQAQRVAIARALLLRPSLLLADEPTSALDVSVQAQILRLLLSLRDTEGLSILFISHDLAVVRTLCDTVHVMFRGEVVEHGATASVFDHPQQEYTRKLLNAIPGQHTPDVAAQASAAFSTTVS